MEAAEWNQKHPAGTPVVVTLANGRQLRTLTISEAVHIGQLDFIKVEAIQPGTVLLSWCWPIKRSAGFASAVTPT